VDTTTLESNIVDVLTKNFTFEEEITPQTDFNDAGLDSLVMLEISVMLERKHGVRITDEELLRSGNIANVVALVRQRVGEQGV
jgi:acyl carrier protein